MSYSRIIGMTLIVSLSVVLISVIVSNYLAKDYFKFFKSIYQDKQNFESNRAQNNDIEQNQLKNEDNHSYYVSKPIVTDNKYSNDNSSKDLLQYNEDYENQPLSNSKQQNTKRGSQKTILGENKNILNTQNSNSRVALSKPSDIDQEDDIMDPPQFCSVKKELKNQEENRLGIQYNKNQGKFGKNSSTKHFTLQGELSSSTQGAIDQKYEFQPQSMCQQLEGIIEEDGEEKGTLTHQQLKKEGILSLNEADLENYLPSKEEEIKESEPRQNTYNNYNNTQFENRDMNSTKFKGILIPIFAMLLLMFYIIGIIYNFYCIYNFTQEGLKKTLYVLGFTLLFDFFIIRIIVLIAISIYQAHKNTVETMMQKSLDPTIMNQLRNLHKTYESQYYQQQNLSEQSQLICDDYEQDASNKNQSQSRMLNFNHNQQKNKVNKRQLGELVIVEQSYFYNLEGMQCVDNNQKDQSMLQQNKQISKNITRSNSKKQKAKGEKLAVSKTLTFNANENELKKANTDRYQEEFNQNSEYDIEEIPMNSGIKPKDRRINQEQEQQRKSSVFPPIQITQQQFETPRCSDHDDQERNQKNISVNQQVISFNEQRLSENKPKKLIKDLLGFSASKSNTPNKNDYQSLQKYLENDKENVQSIYYNQAPVGRNSINHQINSNKKQDRENIMNFTPQYSSQHKKINKLARSIDQSSKQQKLRKSIKEKEEYTDFYNINKEEQDKENSNYQNQASSRQSQMQKTLFENSSKHSKVSQTSYKKQKSYKSPNRIKETLEERMSQMKFQPNISPFNEHKNRVTDSINTMGGDNLPFNGLESQDFTQDQNEIPMYKNKVKKDHEQKNSLVANFVLPQDQNQIDQTNSKEDTIDLQANGVLKNLKANREIKQNKQINLANKQKQLTDDQEDDNQFTFNIQRVKEDKKEEAEVEIEKEEQKQHQENLQSNENIYQDTNRSRLFEDNDASTFRMISFNKKRSTSQNHNSSQRGIIDFYNQKQLQNTKPNKISQKQNKNDQQLTNHSNQDKRQETSPSSKDQVNEDSYQLQKLIKNFDSEEMKIAENEADDLDFKFCRRKSHGRKKSSIAYRQQNHNTQESVNTNKSKNDSSQVENSADGNLLSHPKFKPKKEDDKVKLLRVQEQKRKLKGFLKLAQQLKSKKDENKIKDLLQILKKTKKPLPISKINELKQLELMASPYNQSLVSMIKDEQDYYKKSAKPPSAMSKERTAKSQQRNEIKNGVFIKQLSGIYGSTPSAGSYSSQRRDVKSRESSNIDETSTGRYKQTKNKLINPKARKTLKEQNRNNKASQSNQPIILYQAGEGSSMSNIRLSTSEEEDNNSVQNRNPSKEFIKETEKLVVETEEDS